MATTYWVDHGGSNTAPYDTQVKAAPALATILAIPPAAGDIIFCCDNAGTGEVTVAVLSMASSGTNAAGFIKVIGCNSAGVVDGTRYVIDANNGDFDIVDLAGYDLWWFENIEVKNNGGTTQHGFHSSAVNSDSNVFINCCANDCTGIGINCGNMRYTILVKCVSYLNVSHGFSYTARALFCCARDNTGSGFYEGGTSWTSFGCISHGNTDDGVTTNDTGASGLLINCALDGNTDDGISIAAHNNPLSLVVIGTRITNHSGEGDIGLSTLNEPCVVGWSYFEDNSNLNIQGAAPATSGSLVVGITYQINTYVSNDDFTNVGAASNETGVVFVATGTTPTHWAHASTLSNAPNATFQFIPIENGTTTTNLEDLANTNEGYVTVGSNYATNYVDSGNPDLRRVAITIPWN